MNAKPNSTLLKSSAGSCKPMLAGTLAFCSALALIASSPVSAEESIPGSVSGNDLSRQQLQTFIDSTEVKSTPKTWRNNTSVIAQIGNNNRASVNQARYTAEAAFGNYANIYQNGNANEANIIQTGGNNIGQIGQSGNRHQATIEQHGNRFEARVNQAGYKSNINISQSGSGYRSISVSQSANSGTAAPVIIRTH